MPKRTDIKKILVIGSGPIIIGQAAEFDYAGAQACLALKEEGYDVILCNSNPATIMTDTSIADKIYMEPLTLEYIAKIVRYERPDAILPGIGGQTGLNLAMQLEKKGILKECRTKLLGTDSAGIERAEDRELFKEMCKSLGEPVLPSDTASSPEEGLEIAAQIGYPVVLRPAFTLGGTGGGFAENEDEFLKLIKSALSLSPVKQVLIEKSIRGYKEIEYEVIRDCNDTAITVCNMENVDPVGIHTGDSIVVCPSQTLTNKEWQMLRDSALKIIRALKIEGGCNVQFALDPHSFQYYLIEVNPRVSRSSALASKASGYPIARVSAKISVGMTLDEIMLANTPASFEPALDYIVTKMPRFPFDKFTDADNSLGTQMKATGEVMGVGRTFEESLLKSIRSLETGAYHLHMSRFDAKFDPKFDAKSDVSGHGVPGSDISESDISGSDVSESDVPGSVAPGTSDLIEYIKICREDRIYAIAELLRRGCAVSEIADATRIDPFFIYKFKNITEMEKLLQKNPNDTTTLLHAKKMGFSDAEIARLWKMSETDIFNMRKAAGITPVYKMIDSCASEFDSYIPYFYSTYEEENESEVSNKQKIIVLGSGPIRIGQGVEFDYSTVHAVNTIRKAGYEAIVINNNPETVSTDYTTSDKLYFEPLCVEDVMNIAELEKPVGIIASFGGQTAVNLARPLCERGINIIGTGCEAIERAENRDSFEKLLISLKIPQPMGRAVTNLEDGVEAARKIGYPVLVRPSFVLGGRAMQIIAKEDFFRRYLKSTLEETGDKPVLIDKYIRGKEVEVDAVCDGERVFVPGIMELVERTGIHSGDSISVWPPFGISAGVKKKILDYTGKLGLGIGIIGLFNIQFIVDEQEDVYIIEVNPRSSRTVPFLSKATGYNLADIATLAILGISLRDQGLTEICPKEKDFCYVKAPAFSFSKLHGMDAYLSPEMKSTGEAIGYDKKLCRAMYKALVASGMRLYNYGTVLVTLADEDKEEALPLIRRFYNMGFNIEATIGTAIFLKEHGIRTRVRHKLSEGSEEILDSIRAGYVSYVINSRAILSGVHYEDGVAIRRCAIENNVTMLTSLDTVNVLLDVLEETTMGISPINAG